MCKLRNQVDFFRDVGCDVCEGMNVSHVVPQVRSAEGTGVMMKITLGCVNGSAQPLIPAR